MNETHPGAAIRQLSSPDGTLSAVGPDVYELLAVLPAAIYTTDAAGHITYYNGAAAKLWGCQPELGTSTFCGSWRLYWPDGRPMRHEECPMALALQTGKPVQGIEAVAERPDGTRVPFVAHPTPLYDRAGDLVGAINLLIDVTERKAFEAAERTQARLFQILNGVAKVISDDLDVDRIAQAVTDLAAEASGARFGAFVHEAVDEHRQVRFVQALAPLQSLDALAMVSNRTLLDATLRAGNVIRSGDIRSDERYKSSAPAFPPSGEPNDVVSYLAVPVRRLGKVHGALLLGHPEAGIFTQEAEDIVTGIATHAAIAMDNADLYQSERQLAAIVDTSADAIASKDLNGVVTSWNQGAERLFGYTASDMIGKPITILIPADRQDEERHILDRIRRGERVEHYETVRARKDGSLVDISLSVSPLKDARGRIIGASKIARDITERKQAQARQELLAREVQHRTKNLFAVVLAVVSRSFAGKKSLEEAQAAVLQRLNSLAQTHVLLLDGSWQGADFGAIVRAEMAPYTGRAMIDGPPIMLNTQAAQNFALAVHELATNAAKYGALSSQAGQVRITWSVSAPNDKPPTFLFRWEERGGPAVTDPQRKGFGSTVLEQVMAEYFDVPPQIQFVPSGITYEVSGPLETIAA
jgi:PAS domain S-box-containing protein